MNVTEIGALVTAIVALLGTAATFRRISIDRKHGMRGTELQAGELNLHQLQAVLEAQATHMSHLNDDNATLRQQLEDLREDMAEDRERLDRLEDDNNLLKRTVRVYIVREDILVDHINKNGGPPVPALPPLPAGIAAL